MTQVFGVVGAGVIGSGWATRALARGLDVVATDPDPGAEERMRRAVERAWPSVERLGLFPGADPARLRWTSCVEAVASTASFIQESAPEDEDVKSKLLSEIDRYAPPEVIVASSSSGLLPTRIQATCSHPERTIIGHPFNPVYLLPLVEVVAGEKTSVQTVERTIEQYRDLGMEPLHVRNEVEGYLADRLQEAMWREILHLVNDGVATTEELDRAIVFGPGLRWAAMGTCLAFHLAGGNDGMRHMLEQFGPALKLPWTRMEAPALSDELVERMVAGTESQAAGRSVEQLEDLRDDYLLGVMHALRASGIGAGLTMARHEARTLVAGAPRPWSGGDVVPAPLSLYTCRVAPQWVDYNRHMTESAYLLAFGWASDSLFRYIGIDESYRDSGYSFYTAESHLNYYMEASLGEPLRFTTQVLDLDDKRLHLFHTMLHGDTGDVLCTTEQMLLHVDMEQGRATPTKAVPQLALEAIVAAHRDLDVPSTVGHVIGIAR